MPIPGRLPEPVDVKLEGRHTKILWSDDHQSIHSNKFLRESCPCAACKGETLLFGRRYEPPNPPKASEDIQPLRFGQVGRYALSIEWSDGHRSGIYSYEYLRKICQCDECSRKTAL